MVDFQDNKSQQSLSTQAFLETKEFKLDPKYNGPVNQPPQEFGGRGNFYEKPSSIMPDYLMSIDPQPNYSGPKPKAGLPKFKTDSDPLSWFGLIRDTTKRFQEASLPIDPSKTGLHDPGPLKLDYYVFLWRELKRRYHNMFEDPLYQEKYTCFGTRSKWQPTPQQIPDVKYEDVRFSLLDILYSLKFEKQDWEGKKIKEFLLGLLSEGGIDDLIQQMFKKEIGQQRLDFDPEKAETLPQQMIDKGYTNDWTDRYLGLRCTSLKTISKYTLNEIIRTMDTMTFRQQKKEYQIGLQKLTAIRKKYKFYIDNGFVDQQRIVDLLYNRFNQNVLYKEKRKRFILDEMQRIILIDKLIYTATGLATEIEPLLKEYLEDENATIKRRTIVNYLKFLGETCKFVTRIPKKRTQKSHLRLRIKWIKLFLKLCYKLKFKGKNVISIDETSWKSMSNKQKCYWPKGHPRREPTVQEAQVTLLTAISQYGVELFMIIKGGVNMLTFTYFMSQLEKVVIPRMEKRLGKQGFKPEGIVYLYDNATAHCGGWSGWWMRSFQGQKITIPPYTPEYNPVEVFFNTVKSRFVTTILKKSIPEMCKFVKNKIKLIPKEKFVNYFVKSFRKMIRDLLQFYEPEKYGAPEDKVYAPLNKELKSDVDQKFFEGRYFHDDENWKPPIDFEFPKPEIEAGQTMVKYINKPQKVKKFDNGEEWCNYDKYEKVKRIELFGTLRTKKQKIPALQNRERKKREVFCKKCGERGHFQKTCKKSKPEEEGDMEMSLDKKKVDNQSDLSILDEEEEYKAPKPRRNRKRSAKDVKFIPRKSSRIKNQRLKK